MMMSGIRLQCTVEVRDGMMVVWVVRGRHMQYTNVMELEIYNTGEEYLIMMKMLGKARVMEIV